MTLFWSEELGGLEAGAERRELVVTEGDERPTDVAVVEDPEQLQGGLGGGGAVVWHPHHGARGGQQALIGPQGGAGVAVEEVLDHRSDLVPGGMADDADRAAGAVRHPAEVADVVAAVDGVAQ